MELKQLASTIITSRIIGNEHTFIKGVQRDSRLVEAGDLFLCLPGHTVDGHDFAQQAIEKGAAALVVERVLDVSVPQLLVKDCRYAMAVIADYFYGHPSRSLKAIGITGTNGKTTTTYLIERVLTDAGQRVGVIGTIEKRYGGNTYPVSGTTPEALDLQADLSAMVESGETYCAMEVSSHALEQGRVKGIHYRTAIFTNLTQDHLDYHQTMEHYAAAKSLLFSRLGNDFSQSREQRQYAVLNADDPVCAQFQRVTSAEVITYAVEQAADVRASDIRITSGGTYFKVETFAGTTDITLAMVGKFNVYNALAAIAAALIEGIPLEAIRDSLEAIPGVPGRVESVNEGQPFTVVVDYAHTPDGLENVLRAVKEITDKKLICVFGCGGDRDRTKRPIMGEIAARYADHVIVTSDNPRSENPEFILLDIKVGLQQANVSASRYELISDRKDAIKKAVEMASQGDVVLIAGKGHETVQIIGGVAHEFDDRQVAKEAIRGIKL